MRFILLNLILSLPILSHAQEQSLTTFILLRHAEKAVSTEGMMKNDSPLSAAGNERALRLAKLFSQTDISAIYSTPFNRTQATIQPLAKSKSLPVLSYQPKKIEEIDRLINEGKGKTTLICGHSNTIPQIINYLTNSNYQDFEDNDYGNIVIVTFNEKGKSTKVTWLRY